MSFLIKEAFADAGEVVAPVQGGFEWVFLIVLFTIMYFMIWRPQSKKVKEHNQLLSNLQKGDEVVTGSGIIGTINKIADEFVVIEISEKIEIKFQKNAVIAILPKGTIKTINSQN